MVSIVKLYFQEPVDEIFHFRWSSIKRQAPVLTIKDLFKKASHKTENSLIF